MNFKYQYLQKLVVHACTIGHTVVSTRHVPILVLLIGDSP